MTVYRALPEWLARVVDAALHPFGVHGWSCRGRQDHDPNVGRWL